MSKNNNLIIGDNLGKDVWKAIFSFLPFDACVNFRLVCKFLNLATIDDWNLRKSTLIFDPHKKVQWEKVGWLIVRTERIHDPQILKLINNSNGVNNILLQLGSVYEYRQLCENITVSSTHSVILSNITQWVVRCDFSKAKNFYVINGGNGLPELVTKYPEKFAGFEFNNLQLRDGRIHSLNFSKIMYCIKTAASIRSFKLHSMYFGDNVTSRLFRVILNSQCSDSLERLEVSTICVSQKSISTLFSLQSNSIKRMKIGKISLKDEHIQHLETFFMVLSNNLPSLKSLELCISNKEQNIGNIAETIASSLTKCKVRYLKITFIDVVCKQKMEKAVACFAYNLKNPNNIKIDFGDNELNKLFEKLNSPANGFVTLVKSSKEIVLQ